MRTVTYEEILELNPWMDEETVGRIKAYFDRFGGKMSALDILNLDDVSAKDKLWAVLREEFIPAPILHEFACVCAEYTLSLIDNPDPRSIKAIETKRAWLRGEATGRELDDARDAAYDAAVSSVKAARDAVSDGAWAVRAARAAAWAARDAVREDASDAAWTASNDASDAAWEAASGAAGADARDAQVAYLIMTLEEGK